MDLDMETDLTARSPELNCNGHGWMSGEGCYLGMCQTKCGPLNKKTDLQYCSCVSTPEPPIFLVMGKPECAEFANSAVRKLGFVARARWMDGCFFFLGKCCK